MMGNPISRLMVVSYKAKTKQSVCVCVSSGEWPTHKMCIATDFWNLYRTHKISLPVLEVLNKSLHCWLNYKLFLLILKCIINCFLLSIRAILMYALTLFGSDIMLQWLDIKAWYLPTTN